MIYRLMETAMNRPRDTVVEFSITDFSLQGRRKLAAIYSHASGKEIRECKISWPEPVLFAEINLNDVTVRLTP